MGLRPHPRLGTIEVRICDAQTRLENVAVLVALVQSLTATLAERCERAAPLPVQPVSLVAENKWRAVRRGLAADLVDLARPAAERLGCAGELGLLEAVLDRGDGAAEQRRAADEAGGNLLAVAQWLSERTLIPGR